MPRSLLIENALSCRRGAIYFTGLLDVELLIKRSIFEMNAVRPPSTVDRTAPATVVAYSGTSGDPGGVSYFVWRIDNGPVHGLGWDACQAVMERSRLVVQQGSPPWIPTGSELPSSCVNESYQLFTTYSTTEMLVPGEHTLWHGMVTTNSEAAYFTGWIK